MKRQTSVLSILFLLMTGFILQAQPNIKVPEKIKFANLQLELDTDAQNAVQKKVNGLTRSQRFYEQFVDRCNIYFPIIEEVFAEEKLPEDFKFLALQESALIPDAVSRSNAVGYWQFKDFTAKELGLQINNKVDQRKNIVSASHAAAQYLKKNNRFMRNWLYSLLSYNLGLTGANNISDRSNIGADKMKLDKNTHIYIIHFLAHKIAFEDAIHKSSSLYKLLEYPHAGGKSINEIAKLSQIDPSELDKYNRWLKTEKVPEDRDYHFLLPAPMKRIKELRETLGLDKKGDELIAGKDTKKPDDKKTKKQPSVVKAAYPKITNKKEHKVGDGKITFASINGIHGFITDKDPNLFEIITDLKLSRKKFMKYNDLKITDDIEPFEPYYIKSKKSKARTEDFHVTQQGESLHDVAQMYGVKEKSLRKKNRMRSGEALQPGRVVWLKRKRPKKVPIEIRDVKPKKEEVTDKKDDDKKEDDKKDDSKLNDILEILDEDEGKDDNTTPEIITNGRFHVVNRGETLYAISRQYKISILKLKELNSLGEDLAIKEGQILIVRENDANAGGNTGGTGVDNLDDIIGESIKIDTEGNVIDSLFKANSGNNANTNGGTGGNSNLPVNVVRHTVRPSENLYSISRVYQVTHRDILKWNNIDPLDVLKIGQVLIVSDPNAKADGTIGNNLGNTTTEPMREIKKHTIQRGETLYGISRQYKVSVPSLITWNQLNQNSTLSVGQELYIEDPVAYNQAVIRNNINTNSTKPVYHVVRASDNLPTIAYKYNVTIDHILKKNNLTKDDILVEGQTLLIKDAAPITTTTKTTGGGTSNTSNTTSTPIKKNDPNIIQVSQPVIHIVKKGETLWGISKKYKANVNNIRSWNKMTTNSLSPGQQLIVGQRKVAASIKTTQKTGSNTTKSTGPNVSRASSKNTGNYIGDTNNTGNTNASSTQYHVVKRGDTLFNISKKYKLKMAQLKELNPGLTSNLSLGQRIRVK